MGPAGPRPEVPVVLGFAALLLFVVAPVALAVYVKRSEARPVRPAPRGWTPHDDRAQAADWRIVARVQAQAGMHHAAAHSTALAEHHEQCARAGR